MGDVRLQDNYAADAAHLRDALRGFSNISVCAKTFFLLHKLGNILWYTYY